MIEYEKRQMAPPPRFVPASSGVLHFASWTCLSCGGAGSGERLTGLDDTAEDVRAEAISHVKVTGHPVQFRRGTVEGLHGYATTVPEEG